jgi:hypothetical protein
MTSAPANWLPIALLRSRLVANLAAMATRYPKLAEQLHALEPKTSYFILVSPDRVTLGAGDGSHVKPLPNILPPAGAVELGKKCFPRDLCDRPVAIAGEDLGWLWNTLYSLPCKADIAPGYRPPLYFLIRDVQRLWAILHIQDWQKLLADARVRLFVGDNAFEDFKASLPQNVHIPWPKVSVAVDPTLWPSNLSVDELTSNALQPATQRLTRAQAELRDYCDRFTPQTIAARFTSGQPMKVLGVTSLYTTFLQHSMRDWLGAFSRLGHQTELAIESADHELPCNLSIAEQAARFKPDLVLMIDHYRTESAGLPPGVPCVMWAQDAMPKIYSRQGGAAQGPLDYVIGFSYEKLRLVHELGYPADRYLQATIGMDERRFTPRPANDPQLSPYLCDVALVTHASIPAAEIVQVEINRNPLHSAKQLLSRIYENLRAIYDAGDAVVAPPAIRRIIDQCLLDCRMDPNPDLLKQLYDLFYNRVNNALFRHQTLHWLVELGIDFRLYGKGWEKNPSFKKYARGVAENQGQLSLIYQASRINLQLSPLGSLHQRVMEGLASGGFFLMRRGDGDILGRYYATLHDYCQRAGITTDAALRACADPQIQQTLQQTIQMHQCDVFAETYSFMQLLETMHESNYLCSAGSIWGEDFDKTSFASKSELRDKVAHFLNNPSERQQLTASMLKPVLERFTYEKTSSRLIELIANDQAKQASASKSKPIAA